MERQHLLSSSGLPAEGHLSIESDLQRKPMLEKLRSQAEHYHERIPWLRLLPGPAIAIVLLLVFVQIIVWIAVGIVLHFHAALISTAVLSYTLGLRHALDADHISAIDLMTRRLVASGQRPVTVGTFFSLGHSTIVIITSIIVAASSAAIQKHFDNFSQIGGIIGSSVSAAFLIILGAMNCYILYTLSRNLQTAISTPPNRGPSPTLNPQPTTTTGSCMTHLLRKAFTLVNRPWKMYPLGILFGLGFDTSSEVALLGISSIQASTGTSIWLILIFPLLFTAGMCLLDTVDGAAMLSLYTSARLAQDQIAVLYYQCVLTAITVAVAVSIGVVQILTLIRNVRPELDGGFWRGVDLAGEYYDVIGGAICASFLVFGGLAVAVYRPWRRCVDRKRGVASQDGDGVGQQSAVEDVVEGNWRDDHDGKMDGVRTGVRPVGESSRDAV